MDTSTTGKHIFIQEKEGIKKQVVTNLALAFLGKTANIKETKLALLLCEKVYRVPWFKQHEKNYRADTMVYHTISQAWEIMQTKY